MCFGTNPDCEHGGVERGKDQRQQRQMQGERKQRDLAGDDRIVGMRKISVGSRRDQRLARQHDDARGPSRPQRGKDPQPQALQHDEACECRENDVLIAAPDPQGDQPRRMNRHDQRIVTGADLDRAARQQPARVVAGQNELTQSLQRDQQENGRREAHAACRNATQLAVKPGPSAVSSDRAGRPRAMARSSTNRTVGADMLP